MFRLISICLLSFLSVCLQNRSIVSKTYQRRVTHFTVGNLVEVSSDLEGFVGAWFSTKVVQVTANEKFLVEYEKLVEDDNVRLLREEVDILHIRLCPSDQQIRCFKLLQLVDVLYNDDWWTGVISKVVDGPRYIVYFKETKEEHEYVPSDVRLHQDWINGKWLTPSSQSGIDFVILSTRPVLFEVD
ncbi:hypothetical protein GIB67_001461 [Kingdonia uniflora]|uniref:Agenet domain-containing protein n=1 Tax=Kingdonia uniflora TaxID=39325 RepID=A0A7J7L6P7_9MAGN|nr:hypothetical protein GIB67_001461 [Kingdonia uniflora]